MKYVKVIELKIQIMYNVYKIPESCSEGTRPMGINRLINASRVWKGFLSFVFVRFLDNIRICKFATTQKGGKKL